MQGVSGLDAHSGKARAKGSKESTRSETDSDNREAPKSTTPTPVRPTQPNTTKEGNKEPREVESANKGDARGDVDVNLGELENRVEEMENSS